MHMMFVIALLPVKCQEDQAEHVESREQRGQKADGVRNVTAIAANCERTKEDGILRKEPREQRSSRNCERGDQHRPISGFDFLAEATHVAHVLLASHRVNDRARSEEEQRLEESMRHEVKNACTESADAASQKHIAQLADSRIGENLFDVGLNESDGGREESRRAADYCNDDERGFRMLEENVRARDNVDSRGDYRGCVDQGADRGRALHRVGKQDGKRQLRGLDACSGKEQQAGNREGAKDAPSFMRPLLCRGLFKQLREVERAECSEKQKHSKHKAKIADAIDDKGFLAGVCRGFSQKGKADEQVARKADALPADKEKHIVR